MEKHDILGFEWDENKNASNFAKHGLLFEEAIAMFNGFVSIRRDERRNYGEDRFIAGGMVQGQCMTLVFTQRPHGICRIISVRKARKDEREIYHEDLGRHQAADPGSS
jgi:uncharacterized DUF497 family protein